MAQYNITIPGIDATMLDELADFATRAWGNPGLLEVEAVPSQVTQMARPVELALPEPVSASSITSSIEIILPPEEIPSVDEEDTPPRKRR